MRFSRAIRTARSARGWSQKELARRAKLDPSFVSHLEAGSRKPSADTVSKLSTALGIPETLLFLLGAERSDLRHISDVEAALLGRELLSALVGDSDTPSSNGVTRK